MRSGADFSDELSGASGILGRGGAVVAGFEVDLAQLGLGSKVHTESAAGQVKAGIAPQHPQQTLTCPLMITNYHQDPKYNH